MILVKIQLIIIIANPPLGHAVWGLGFYHRPPPRPRPRPGVRAEGRGEKNLGPTLRDLRVDLR